MQPPSPAKEPAWKDPAGDPDRGQEARGPTSQGLRRLIWLPGPGGERGEDRASRTSPPSPNPNGLRTLRKGDVRKEDA